MRILIIANHYVVCSGRYMADAFTRLGHDVCHVGPNMDTQIWGLTLPEQYAWMPEPGEVDCNANLTIIADSDRALLTRMANHAMPTPVVIWGVDNHVRRYNLYPDQKPGFERYFLAHHDGPAQAVRQADEEWLPCGYDPALHVPSPIPWAERDYDVAVVGVMYPNRIRLVNELRAAGVKVFAATGLVYDQYVEAYHNARISLCASICGDVAQRVFETAAMGCVVMSDPCADFQRLRPNGIWLYDLRDAVRDVRTILSDPALAEANVMQSMAWVKGHTWDARAARIVDWYTERNGSE